MGKRKRSRAKVAEVQVAERHGFDSSGMLGHDSGDYAVNVTEQVALAVDSVLACVRILADLTADASVGEYRGTERLPDSRLTRRPMASVTRRTWLWMVTATMALYNGCYLWRRFGRDAEGIPVTLQPVAPSRVQWQDGTTVYVDGAVINADDLRWVPRMTFPTVGRDLAWIIRLAQDSIGAAWAAGAYSASFWEAGGAPRTQITTDQPISATEAAGISDLYAERRALYPGRPAVFGKGAKLEALGADVSTDGATEAAAALGSSVARYFGVPAWLVNVPSAAGSMVYANSSAAGLDLVRYTLQPGYAGPIGDALSDELPGDYLSGRRVVLDLAHLTRGTMLEQSQAYQIATGGQRWLLPSEVRADLHLPIDMTLDDAGTPAPVMESIA